MRMKGKIPRNVTFSSTVSPQGHTDLRVQVANKIDAVVSLEATETSVVMVGTVSIVAGLLYMTEHRFLDAGLVEDKASAYFCVVAQNWADARKAEKHVSMLLDLHLAV